MPDHYGARTGYTREPPAGRYETWRQPIPDRVRLLRRHVGLDVRIEIVTQYPQHDEDVYDVMWLVGKTATLTGRLVSIGQVAGSNTWVAMLRLWSRDWMRQPAGTARPIPVRMIMSSQIVSLQWERSR